MQPEKIGKFEIVRLIGEGSTGKVYKAFDPIIDRFVALKVIPGERVNQPDVLNRFKKEVRTQGRVIHPNVTVIFDVHFVNGDYVIVMEYVQGRTLREMLRKEKVFALPLFYRLTRQICSGLAFAHRQGVIHRDIKPENVNVSDENKVKILDFSIAKFQASATITGMNFLLGSAHYMSPEQVLGMPVTPAADQFALGVICFEMLAGRRPFRSDSVADSILSITKDDPPALPGLNPVVDKRLSGIILQTLAKEPSQRYPTVTHFGKALLDYFSKTDPALVEAELYEE